MEKDPNASQNDVDQEKAAGDDAMNAALGQTPQAPAVPGSKTGTEDTAPALPAAGNRLEDNQAAVTPAQPQGEPASEAQAPPQEEKVDAAAIPVAEPVSSSRNPMFPVLIALAALRCTTLVARRLRASKQTRNLPP